MAEFQSVPRDYPLLSRSVDGSEVPTMVLRVDSVVYPAQIDYKQFLTSGAPRTPEQLYARYIDLLLAPRADETAYLAMFSPERQSKDEDIKRLLKNYEGLRRYAPKFGAPTLRRRYDFGDSSLLDVEFARPTNLSKEESFWALFALTTTVASIKTTGNRAYFTGFEWSSIAFNLINLVYARKEPLPGKQNLPYSLVVSQNSAGGESAPENLHRVTVLFDGTVLSAPLDGVTQTPDAAVNFVQEAARVHRTGNIAAILPLWSDESAKDIRVALDKNIIQSNYELVKALLSDASLRVVFVIESDEGALIFLRRPNPSKNQSVIEVVTVFKKADGFKLSFKSDGALGKGNLDKLLQSPDFQSYLLGSITQSAA